MGNSTTLVSAVTGGVQRRMLRTVLGTATQITEMAMYIVTTTTRTEGYLFVVSRIELFGKITNEYLTKEEKTMSMNMLAYVAKTDGEIVQQEKNYYNHLLVELGMK